VEPLILNSPQSRGLDPQGKTLAAGHEGEYQNRNLFGRDNPDLELIADLKDSGVTLHVCGQMLGFKNYERVWVNPAVIVVLGNAAALMTYQLKGYAFIIT